MSYLMIQNKGQSDLNAFLLLGASTTRNSDDGHLIGKFGSGIKHAIITLLRNDVKFSIFLGEDEITFYTKAERIKSLDGDCVFDVVYANYKDKDIATGFTLQFGMADWVNVDMALREVVSNALDASYKTCGGSGDCVIDIAHTLQGKSDTTRIYVQLCGPVKNYYNNLNKNFLHFAYPELDFSTTHFLDKPQVSMPKVYRRGVLVCEVESSQYVPSLFDYSFADVKLDESRNMNQYLVKSSVSDNIKQLTDDQFKSWVQQWTTEKLLENQLDTFYIQYQSSWISSKSNWAPIVKATYGPNPIFMSQCSLNMANKLVDKGYNIVVVSPFLEKLTIKLGFPDSSVILNDFERKTNNIKVAPKFLQDQVLGVYEWVFELNAATHGKKCPDVFTFEADPDSQIVFGYAHGDGIYINSAYISEKLTFDCKKTIIEELMHYLSEAEDCSKNMQDNLVALLAKMS